MSKSKDLNKLGDMFPFEYQVLEAYFGEYMKDAIKKNVIMYKYFKVRMPEYLEKIVYRLDRYYVLWKLLLDLEGFMGLPFRSIDGRDGATYSEAMPQFAVEWTQKELDKINAEQEAIEKSMKGAV